MNKLNFGCGKDIKQGWDNVDLQKGKEIFKSFDFNKHPYPLEESHYDLIYANNVIEHLEQPEKAIYEFWRISKKNAIIHLIVPYYNNKGAFNDMTHLHYFSDHTFIKFVEEPYTINKKRKFKIHSLTLNPTKIGKILPKKLREGLSLFIGGLIAHVDVKLKVIK